MVKIPKQLEDNYRKEMSVGSVRSYIVSSDMCPTPAKPKRTNSSPVIELMKRTHAASKAYREGGTKTQQSTQKTLSTSSKVQNQFVATMNRGPIQDKTRPVPQSQAKTTNRPQKVIHFPVVKQDGKTKLFSYPNSPPKVVDSTSIVKPPLPRIPVTQMSNEKIQKLYAKQVTALREKMMGKKNDSKKNKLRAAETKLSLLTKHAVQDQVPEPQKPVENPEKKQPQEVFKKPRAELADFGTSDLHYLEKKGIDIYEVNIKETPRLKPAAKAPNLPSIKSKKSEIGSGPRLQQRIGDYLASQIHTGIRKKETVPEVPEVPGPRKIEALFARKTNSPKANYVKVKTGVKDLPKLRASRAQEDFRKNVWEITLIEDENRKRPVEKEESPAPDMTLIPAKRDISAQFEKYIPRYPLGLRLDRYSKPELPQSPSIRHVLKNLVPYGDESSSHQLVTGGDTDRKASRLVNIIKMSSDIVNRSKRFLNTSGLLSAKVKTIEK